MESFYKKKRILQKGEHARHLRISTRSAAGCARPGGELWEAFWSPFGSLLAPFWLPLAPFWRHLAPFWFPAAPFGYFWLHFGSLFRTLGVNFHVFLFNFLIFQISSDLLSARFLPELRKIDWKRNGFSISHLSHTCFLLLRFFFTSNSKKTRT